MKLLPATALLAAGISTPAFADAGVSIAGVSLTDAIALIAVVVSTAALFRTRVSEAKQSKIQEATFIREYNDGVQAWGNEAIDRLTDAAFLCEVDPVRLAAGEFFERRQLLKVALSALIDKGRLFLPNTHQKTVGQDRPGAYQGLREAALDWLVEGFELVQRLNYLEQEPNLPLKSELIKVKREFTSELQKVLDVHKTRAEIRRLAAEIRAAD